MMSPHYNRNIFPPNPHYFQSLEGDFRGPGTTENSKSLTIAKFRLTKVHSILGSLHVIDLCTYAFTSKQACLRQKLDIRLS